MHEPKLLIFDEPFSGFDPVNANLIKDEILKLRDNGASIIFSTHRMESVEEMCDYIALINKSNKILDGKLNDIKHEFKENKFEVGFVSDKSENIFEEIKQKYKAQLSENKTQDEEFRMLVTLNNGETSKDLIKFLNKKVQINHFTEIIPTANDIFLKSVASHE